MVQLRSGVRSSSPRRFFRMKRTVVLSVVILLAVFYIALSINPSKQSPFLKDTMPSFIDRVPDVKTSVLHSFENGQQAFKVDGARTTVLSSSATHGNKSLKASARFNGKPGAEDTLTITMPPHTNWGKIGMIFFDVMVHGRGIGASKMQVLLSVKTGEDRWYQLEYYNYLPLKKWSTLYADFSGRLSEWLPIGHREEWGGYSRQFIKEFSIRFYDKNSGTADIYLDNVRYTTAETPDHSKPTRIAGMYPERTNVPLYGKFELSFNINKVYTNPFDPEEVDIRGVFIAPSGKVSSIPAFFYQSFERRMEKGYEKLSPDGRRCWKIRFCPTEVGEYTYYVTVRDGADLKTGNCTFRTTPSDNKGFVRVSREDSRYFEFDNGDFYYPIGMNIVSPWDSAYGNEYVRQLPRGKKTYAYDDYFRRMKENGANWIRIWMANWWVEIEWTRGNGPFVGLGRYSLENAWRLDYLLEQAKRSGIYIDLTIENHVKFNRNRAYHWKTNPYNRRQGGPCRRVEEFFTKNEAKRIHKKKLRYIIARWGYSTHLFAWDLWSEAEFAKTWQRSLPRYSHLWHREMLSVVRQMDPWNHMTSTHFNKFNASPETWRLPEMDFVHATFWPDCYRPQKPIEEIMVIYDRECRKYGKPYFCGEFGGNWTGSRPDVMARDLHAGLWRTITQPAGATPMFWWWNLLHNYDLYHEFKALANFLEGEDFRGAENRDRTENVKSQSFPLEAYSFGNDRWRIAWVADPLSVYRVSDAKRICRGAEVTISGLREGAYRVEVWDTIPSEIITTIEARSSSGNLNVKLPEFNRDVALKVKAIENSENVAAVHKANQE